MEYYEIKYSSKFEGQIDKVIFDSKVDAEVGTGKILEYCISHFFILSLFELDT